MDDDGSSIFDDEKATFGGRRGKRKCYLCRVPTETEVEICPLFNAKNLQYITSTTELEFEAPHMEMFVKEIVDSIPANSTSAVTLGQTLQAKESSSLPTDKHKKKHSTSKKSSTAHTSKGHKSHSSTRDSARKSANKTKVKVGTQQTHELVYKTPSELQKERDQQRDEMVAAAEAQDKINHRVAVSRRVTKSMQRGDNRAPLWYQELSTQQMKLVESLGAAIYADIEEGSMSNTRKLLADLGMVPIISKREIAPIVTKSYGNPILFLLYLARSLGPAKRSRNMPYSIRERLLLSAMTHLTIPRTLNDLHALLPAPRKRRIRLKPKLVPPKKIRYAHTYVEPQPIDAARWTRLSGDSEEKEPLDITRSREKLLKVVALDKQQSCFMSMTEAEMIQRQSLYSVRFQHASSCRFPSRERKSTYFMERHKQMQALWNRLQTVVEVEQTVHELNEAPSKVTRILAINSIRSFDSPRNIAFPLPRFLTSTDPPDMDSILSYQMPAVPANSFVGKVGEISMMQQPAKLHFNSLVVDKFAAGDKEVEDPIERLVLMGYFEAVPKPVQYNESRRVTFNTKDPSYQIHTDLKTALAELAYEGNPLASLPQAYKLPHFHKWLLRRSGFKMTDFFKAELENTLQMQCEACQSKPYKVQLPEIKLSPRLVRNLTWNKRLSFGRKANKIKGKYYSDLRKALVEDTRLYWPAMGLTYFDNKEFRNVFFAYLPAKEDDLVTIC